MTKDLFTAGDISRICQSSRKTVNRWLHDGDLKGYRPTKKSDWRITRKELINFMTENNIPLEFLNEDKIKILIVDDEVSFTRYIEREFKDVEKFSLEIANSGFTAGIKVGEFKPDVIVLDIYLGDIDGRELFNHIKENPEMNGAKVIGISGRLNESEIQPLIEQGFYDFLQKPFEIDELKKIILKDY